jgi:GNAT superfamily N-acetyltransferase
MKNFEKPPVRIRQIEGAPPRFTGDELARLATTYADVFAGNPWREVSRCKDGFSPEPVGLRCEDCGDMRSEAYPLVPQMETITAELSRPNAACFVVEDEQNGAIVGFSWGFAYENVEELLAQKYDGAAAEYAQLQDDVRRVLGRYGIGAQAFYYLSETGIIDDPRYRGRGISKELVRRRQDVAESQGLDIVQRTSIESPMYRTMHSAGFTQVMGRNIDVPDVVNTDRALFVKKQTINIAIRD